MSGSAWAQGTANRAVAGVDFNSEIRPIFVKHCLACHGGVRQAGGMSFVWQATALGEGDSGVAIEPGNAEASYLLERVTDPDNDSRMPPPEHGRRLNASEIDTLRRWIDGGAVWDKPWAFKPPADPGPPGVDQTAWPRSAIDRFVLKRIEGAGLGPSPEADRSQWLRRASFDLVGMPPTEEENAQFASDLDEGAHERAVDRLLASQHFGERWASLWLDLARYADTMGYERDPPRDMWPYRDWLIHSLNDDLPYDEFLKQQLAGDLLPEAGIAERLASAFHRNSQTNVEGGTDDEEFRLAAVVDRVDTTWQALQGISFGCARCHDHPYDPITQAEYYRSYAFFNSTRDADLSEDWPKLATPTDAARWPEAERLDEEIADLRSAVHTPVAGLAGDLGQWEAVSLLEAESTGSARLIARPAASVEGLPDAVGEAAELVAEGTVTDQSIYAVTAAPPAAYDAPRGVTAVRIDALPKDIEAARRLPEVGFVLSRFRLTVERPDGTSEEAFFAAAYGDEAAPFFDAEDALSDNAEGWGVYTKLRRPRWSVFLLDRPLEMGPDDRLVIEMKHGKKTDGQGALVIYRSRLSLSSDRRWTALLADADFRKDRERLVLASRERAAIPSTSVPIMQERPTKLSRPTTRLERGNWLSPQEGVTPGVPAAIGRLAPDKQADRLALAEWIASRENPLTARVLVNRGWAELFGAGLVDTLDDFGSTGEAPSHPELLDHLATRFQTDWGWSFKRLLREIVLSATYRQDARVTAGQVALDPANRLLARGPRGRLRAEMVRDQALLLSGRFNPAPFGPPVMPHQPDGVWRTVHSGARWENAKDDARFRRAVYTYWKRTAAYPSLMAFDMPTREVCTARRPTTNTPLQALVTLNDPAFHELAEGFADRMLDRADDSVGERIGWGYRLATGQAASPASVETLETLYAEALASAGTGEDAERFAMTLVASAIMNLDAALSK